MRVAIARLEVQVAHIDGLIQAHDVALSAIEKRLGPLESDIERMKKDIGTHDTGIRGATHDHANMLSKHEMRLHALDHYPIQDLD